MNELRVMLRFSADDQRPVGVLAEDGPRVWFEFDPSFVAAGVEISPLRLPLQVGLQAHRYRPGVPIPGVFNDARPEGWGLKLLHRAFQAVGRPVSSVSPLEELAFLGANTMGALCFAPTTGPSGALDDAVALGALAAHAQAVWDDRTEVVLPDLLRAAGPSGGARPKALIGLRRDGAAGVRFGEGALPDDWEAWLVKFPTSADDPEVARREVAWMNMARRAGLDTTEVRLLPLGAAGEAFATRRFDRPGGDRRVHLLSAAGAFDVDFRTPAADYDHLLRATGALCDRDPEALAAMFRWAVFNVAACNDDDHLRNFAWCLDASGRWRVSPAFDLTYAPRPSRERWTTVAGIGREVQRGDLLRLAANTGIRASRARALLDEVLSATAEVRNHLRDLGCDRPVSAAAAQQVEATTCAMRA